MSNFTYDTYGNTTSYGYDAQTGVLNWVQAPGETAETRTNYTYDNLYRTTQVEKDGTSNSYTYTDDLLAGITSASDTAYTFTYGVFDQIASVKVGDRTLISHTYTNDANRRLSKSEYGNGDYITYAYDSRGVTLGAAQDTLLAEYNDLSSVNDLFEKNVGEIAAVIIEPVAANMGVVLPNVGFLPELRRICDKYGALLIFDEVITGPWRSCGILWCTAGFGHLRKNNRRRNASGRLRRKTCAYGAGFVHRRCVSGGNAVRKPCCHGGGACHAAPA